MVYPNTNRVVDGIDDCRCCGDTSDFSHPLRSISSGLEARFAAQVAHSCEGMTPADANLIVRSLVSKYANRQKELQKGKSFLDIYNLDLVQPTDEWRDMYEAVAQELHTEYGLFLRIRLDPLSTCFLTQF